jgi:hypothetical protein
MLARPYGCRSEVCPSHPLFLTLGGWMTCCGNRIVRENIQTALIFEDDADWDVMFKHQMYEFAKGAQAVQGVAGSQHSPYGDEWDILWIGHCSVQPRKTVDQPYFVIPDDPTVAPQDRIYGPPADRSPPALQGNNTRLIFRGVSGRCLTGYGLSLRGAQRLIYKQSMTGATTIDRGVSGLCSGAPTDFTCVAPYPPFVGPFKDAGDVTKDSDRVSVKGGPRKYAMTRDIAYPVRLNIDRLLKKGSNFRPQWSEEGGHLPELPRDAVIPEGHLEWITKEQYSV